MSSRFMHLMKRDLALVRTVLGIGEDQPFNERVYPLLVCARPGISFAEMERYTFSTTRSLAVTYRSNYPICATYTPCWLGDQD